jgi:hypothetical protein
MKKTLLKGVVAVWLCFTMGQALAQQTEATDLGSVSSFVGKLTPASNARGSNLMRIPISEGQEVEVVKRAVASANGLTSIVGPVNGDERATMHLRIQDGKVEGSLVNRAQKRAWVYTTIDGKVFVEETDINAVLCTEFDRAPEQGATEQVVLLAPPVGSPAYNLNSLPTASAVAYLDFDGELVVGTAWNSGNAINAVATNYSEAQITEIWELISEDFRPFNINVTTSLQVYQAAPTRSRMRCIFTSTTTAAPGAGGVAYLNSFNWGNDTPCWVFNSGVKAAGETGSHELGHTFGLRHDGRTTPAETYFSGHNNWGPIMGSTFSRPIAHWSIGEYANANEFQDDVNLIGATKWAFGFRTDDHSNTTTSATVLTANASNAVSSRGIITTRTDLDVFQFTTGTGTVSFNVNTVSRHGNLDIQLRLLNASGAVVQTINPTGLNASFSSSLTAGTYFLEVNGVGALDPLTNGYSDYGSLGTFTVSGTVAPTGSVNQAPTVAITAPANNASFTAPASISIAATAADTDGSIARVEFFNGSTKLGEDATAPYTFSWTSIAAGTYTISVRATDNLGALSNNASVSVVVNPPAPTCNVPTGLSVSSITATTATLNWAAQTGASQYLVWWRDITQPWTLNTTVTTSSYNVTGLAAGKTYEFTVAATCNGTNTGYASPYVRFNTPAGNQLPTVSLTAPANNASFTAPANVSFTATAADADGSIARVEFWVNGSKLSEDNTNPYGIVVSFPNAGTFDLQVVAVDNVGASTSSSSIRITINPATNPSICTNVPAWSPSITYAAPGNKVTYNGRLWENKWWTLNEAPAPSQWGVWRDLGSCTSAQAGTTQNASTTANLSVYPNPTVNGTTVVFSGMEQGFVSVDVSDQTGKQVFRQEGVEQNAGGMDLDTHTWPAGIYIVQVTDGENTYQTKLIKY